MNETELKALLSRIRPADSAAKAAAKERQSKLAKPPGSLGALEEISVRLAGITGRVCNRIEKTRIVVFAADNGIVAEGVASTPQSVTLAQAINMTRGKTGMSAIARNFGIDVEVIDVGINSDSVPLLLLSAIRVLFLLLESYIKYLPMRPEGLFDRYFVLLSGPVLFPFFLLREVSSR